MKLLREVEEGSNGDSLPGNDRRMEELGNEIRREKGLPPHENNSTLPGATKESSPTTPGKQSSILDGIGDTFRCRWFCGSNCGPYGL
jgi:hypothetical protein